MAFHSWRSFRRHGWRERSTWIGAALVLVGIGLVVASFAFSAAQIAEYGQRWVAIGTALPGVVGVGLMLLRTARGEPPGRDGGGRP